jgi:pimeloyl-ACP methyl ester carboxylesterase
MTVAENRKGGSKTIQLPAIVLKGTKPGAASAPPLVLINGGPGTPSLTFVEDVALPYRDDRDVVLVNERGVTYSKPQLLCPELDKLRDGIYGSDGIIRPISSDAKRAAEKSCAERLRADIDLASYNIYEMTSDVDETLRTLGYDKYSVWGVSFGTIMAQSLAKRFPTRVHNIILDSPATLYADDGFPSLTGNVAIDVLSAIPDAIKRLFEECGKDPTCNSKYPNLGQTFADTLAKLESKPLVFTTTHDAKSYTWELTPTLLYGQVANSMGAGLIGYVPRVIYAVKKKLDNDPNQDTLGLTALQTTIEKGFDPGPDGSSTTDALFGVVACSGWNFVSEDEVKASDPLTQKYLLELVRASVRDCHQVWNVPKLANVWPEAHTPLESDTLPALIMPGKFDSNTPPLKGNQIASHLKHGYLLVTPDRGHVVLSECSTAMTLAFLLDPSKAPDATCLEQLALSWK